MSKTSFDLSKLRGIVFDVDGVLSPSTIPMNDQGVPMRMVNIKDGYAMQLAAKCGIRMAIITGANTESIRVRYEALGIKDVYLRAAEKMPVLKMWLEQEGLSLADVAYVGDDIPDIVPMREVALAVAPADAAHEVKQVAKYITVADGGHGVARELLEQVLRAKHLWMNESKAFGW